MAFSVQAQLALTQQFGLVGGLVGLQVLPMLSDVAPGPHVAATPDVDLQDTVEAVPPPDRGTENKPTQNCQNFCL